ncbi:transporter substrate-binding domain-containing protein [Salipiger sp. PrR002]|uniref:transporter substrate-binding domain-containing protein n=1 Tax=Salipiger sp. PrR002 TaxID=2706489 RepID=UPI0013BA86DF|nr:transporter substrate-binding domain-containing protein [Salipiger sp. PrR002]NDW01905.1 transporter substrate-binding domain-containing protein [Salipiger sp. PrR002]NDW59065.1 transporter substrate-binding domain-containing protein [Salipiger sp. PrR004]
MNRRTLLKTSVAGLFFAGTTGVAPLFAAPSEVPERIKAAGKLRIGGVTDAAPTFRKDMRSDEWSGIFIDVGRALAEDMGVELEIVTTTWGNSVLDLQADKIDLMFGLNPTPERRKAIDFSDAVFNNAFTLICHEDAIFETWEEYNRPEIRIAVDAGSSHDATVTRMLPKATILRFESVAEASIALQSGRADAQCFVMMLGLPVVKKNPSMGTIVAPEPLQATTSHAGFQRTGDTALQDYVNAWLAERRESGFIQEAVIRNMALVGVTPEDFPANVQL